MGAPGVRVYTQVILGTAVTVATVVFHIAGLVALIMLLNRIAPSFEKRLHPRVGTSLLIIIAVLGTILVHTIEVWAWALLYVYLGEFSDVATALYFSVSTATTVGYGDIILTPAWQVLGTFESMSGLILFGASTAFLFGLVRHLFEQLPRPLRPKS